MRKNVTRTLAIAASFAVAASAQAASITFSLPDFTASTVQTTGINPFPDPATAPALPDAATFSLPVAGLLDSANQLHLTTNLGRFVRYAFDLPSGYSNVALAFRALVNDEFVVYLNGVVVAQQTSTGTDNFVAPLPGFVLGANGIAVDASEAPGVTGKLEYLLRNGMAPLFVTGRNELTLFGTDTLQFGAIAAIDGQLDYDAPTGVPEPASLGCIAVGLLGLVALRRRNAAVRT